MPATKLVKKKHALPVDAQMNIRINSELKEQGDALFIKEGLSPSEAVRRFYEFSVEQGSNSQELSQILHPATQAEQQERENERKRKRALHKKAQNAASQFLSARGLTTLPWEQITGGASDNELVQDALYAKYFNEAEHTGQDV